MCYVANYYQIEVYNSTDPTRVKVSHYVKAYQHIPNLKSREKFNQDCQSHKNIACAEARGSIPFWRVSFLKLAETFAIIFLRSGIGKILDFSGTQQFMNVNGIPLALTGILLAAAIIFQLVGGLSVLLGYKAPWGALILILFLVPTTLIFHNPFAPQQMIAFLKNLGLIGGLLMVNDTGAGSISLDARN